MNASGDNGSIEVVVPEIESGYDVTAETSNGRPTTSTSWTIPSRRTQLRLETDNGSISVHAVG